MMKTRLLFVGLLVMLTFGQREATAQDPEFTQFYAAPLYMNPAYAGTTLWPKFHLNFRDQWPAFGHAYVSYAASYDQYFENFNSGLGLSMIGDDAGEGIYKTMMLNGVYSYQANISQDFALKFGIQLGFIQRKIDISKLFFYDQIDPVTGFYDASNNPHITSEALPATNSLTAAEIGGGMLAFSRQFYFGVAAKHINQPAESFTRVATGSRLPMRWSIHTGGTIQTGQWGTHKITISPGALYTRQASFSQFNLGASMKVSYVFAGFWFRHNLTYADAFILMAGVQYNVIKVGYSYDLTLLDLQAHSGGGHEVSITINLQDHPNAPKSFKLHGLHCPDAF